MQVKESTIRLKQQSHLQLSQLNNSKRRIKDDNKRGWQQNSLYGKKESFHNI